MPPDPRHRQAARRGPVRAVLSAALALVSLGAAAQAQSVSIPMGGTIKDWEKPFTTDAGVMQYKVSGSDATRKSINRIAVQDLKIVLFDNGEQSMSIASPKADFWETKSLLSSRDSVKIDRGDMVITAQTIMWNLAEEEGVLRKNVRVEMTGFDMGASGTGTGEEGTAISGGDAPPTDLTSPPRAIQPAPGSLLFDGVPEMNMDALDSPDGGAPPAEPNFDPSLFNR